MYLYVCAHVRAHTPRTWSPRPVAVRGHHGVRRFLCAARHTCGLCVLWPERAPVTPFTLSRVPHRVPSGNRQGVALLPPAQGLTERENSRGPT